MLTKTVEVDFILQNIAKWESRQYHNPDAGIHRAVFQHSFFVADTSCFCYKNVVLSNRWR